MTNDSTGTILLRQRMHAYRSLNSCDFSFNSRLSIARPASRPARMALKNALVNEFLPLPLPSVVPEGSVDPFFVALPKLDTAWDTAIVVAAVRRINGTATLSIIFATKSEQYRNKYKNAFSYHIIF